MNNNANELRKKIMDRCKVRTIDSDSTVGTARGITGNYRKYHVIYEAVKEGMVNTFENNSGETVFDFDGQEVKVIDASIIDVELLNENMKDYYNKVLDGAISDAVISESINNYKTATNKEIEETLIELKKAYGLEMMMEDAKNNKNIEQENYSK